MHGLMIAFYTSQVKINYQSNNRLYHSIVEYIWGGGGGAISDYTILIQAHILYSEEVYSLTVLDLQQRDPLMSPVSAYILIVINSARSGHVLFATVLPLLGGASLQMGERYIKVGNIYSERQVVYYDNNLLLSKHIHVY